jgi:hypothetical protein
VFCHRSLDPVLMACSLQDEELGSGDGGMVGDLEKVRPTFHLPMVSERRKFSDNYLKLGLAAGLTRR